MNIVEPIFVQCRNRPAELALCAPGTRLNMISYGRLAQSVNNICGHIISAGLVSGNRVALFISDPILHAIMVIAMTRLGIVTLSGRGGNLPLALTVDAVVADRSLLSGFAVRTVSVNEDWILGDGKPPAEEYLRKDAPDDNCRIILTSGTTGGDKAVAISHRTMALRIERQYAFFGPRAAFCRRTYLDLGLGTSLGVQLLFGTLWRGGALFMHGEAEPTVRSFPVYRVQNIVASPAGFSELLGAMEKRPEYRCGFEAAFSGGSLLSRSLAERVGARICPNLTKGYGSTEAAEVASMPAHFAPDVAGAVGYVMPGVEVQIVDEAGTVAPAAAEGIIRIRSETAVERYMNDSEESARVFRDGWFYPGDTGYLSAENMLVVTGRVTSVVNVGGEKINPETIEEVLSWHASVEQAAVIAVPAEDGIDALCALIVPRSQFDEDDLASFCRARLGAKFVPGRFFAVAGLARNEMGKIERLKLPDLIRGKLN